MSDENETMLKPPCEFGRFIVERELGHGGMGGVYLARDKMLDRQVALKVMLKSLGEDPQFLERFKREAQAAARLIHPAIAQIYSYDIVEGQPYIAMEMAGGGSLLKLMEVHGKNIDPTRVMRICKQVAEGLSCAADQGLVHGDIKPENILFDATGQAKVVDFGLAGMQDENSGDEIWGTPYYIAPEKVRKGSTDFRVDMYSLGATIYHAITGVAPFEGEDPNEVVKARFLQDPKAPSELRSGLPKEIDRILLKMIAREVADRYPTWEACLGDINRLLAGGIVMEAAPAATEAAPAAQPAATGTTTATHHRGKRIMVKGKRKTTVSTVSAAPAENANAPEEGEQPAEGAEGAENADEVVAEGEEEKKPKVKKEMTIGKMIMLGAIAIVAILGLAAGGIVWYMSASKAAEEAQRIAVMNQKADEAREALKKTLKNSEDFAGNVTALRVKAEKEVKEASDSFLAMLDPDMREECRKVIITEPTKEYTDAVAYSNQVAATIAAKNEEPKAEEKPAETTTNAPAATAAPAATNAPAATPASAATPTPAATNAPAATAVPAATNAPAAKAEAKPAAKAAPAKPAAKPAKPAAKPVAPAPEPVKEEKKIEYPPQLKAFQQLWTDLYTIRAAEIRVNAALMLIRWKTEAGMAIKVTDKESAEKLARSTADTVEEFEAMKSHKTVEQALKKSGAIRQKAPTLVTTTKQQIERAKARAAKLAAERAAAEAAEAAKKKAAEEYAAKVEKEIADAKAKYDAVAERELKRLDWAFAEAQILSLTNSFEKLTREGTQAVKDQAYKVHCMGDLHRHFIAKARGFEFNNHVKVVQADKDSITLQRPTPKARSLKDRPVAPKPERYTWKKFYFEQRGRLNQLIIGLVQDRSKARVGLKEWSNLMFGAAATMTTLFPDDLNVPKRAEELVKSAIEEFDACQAQAERIFPEMFQEEGGEEEKTEEKKETK